MTVFRYALALALLAIATEASAQSARAQLESFARGLTSLQGTFSQETQAKDGRTTDRTSGKVALNVPRLLRWEYEQPFPQLIVADGLNIWTYDRDLEQATVRAQASDEARSPLMVLIEPGQLDREYKVSEVGAGDEVRALRLVPKGKDAGFASCELRFGSDGPSSMRVTDNLGQTTDWRFGPWQRNLKLDPALFRFDPPQGTDVIGEPIRGAEVTPLLR